MRASMSSKSCGRRSLGKRIAMALVSMAILYWLVTYVTKPFAWQRSSKHRPAREDVPGIVPTGGGIPADRVNVSRQVLAPPSVTAELLPKEIAAECREKATACVGSKSCRECHADFYQLWSTSWHGLAMQPYTAEFAQGHLTPQEADMTIGTRRYRAEIAADEGWICESGPEGGRKYPIAQVMGGKNVYYLLTPLERGRLQVLPLAYDVHKRAWYDMAASGVRHFPDQHDAALEWTDRRFAFNTSCFNCHVSELATNYHLATDTYHTTWSEPGISCESCHGPAQTHVRAMEGELPASGHDLGIIRTRQFTPRQMNDLCATCHAKLIPLSLRFSPGDGFFDHFDLITLEHADFYPDGRDLGENYTYTSWRMSRCGGSGKLDCNHCHTPSGRMRLEAQPSNQMCMPCHAKEVQQPAEHGHHRAGSKGNECVGCHMPMTRFAAMGRTDHSMRPPTPATTLAFQSPNACNLCHTDHDAAWADQQVRRWYKDDYQVQPMRRAELIDQARKRQWKRLPEILAELRRADKDEVYKNSLVRLLGSCEDASKWPVLRESLQDPSALVRSSAVSAFAGHVTPEVIPPLLAAAADSTRLVRIRAAMVLAGVPREILTNREDRRNLSKADRDFILAMQARPDDWASHANLGNFYLEGRDFSAAATCFETASRLEPRVVEPMVNASMAYSNLGQDAQAEASLRRALKADPNNAAASFNLGLLLGERGRVPEAEAALRTAVRTDPQMAAAAYNLGVLLGRKDPGEALLWCEKAHTLRPSEPEYAHALAYFRWQAGDIEGAIRLLREVVTSAPRFVDAYLLLGQILDEQGDYSAAGAVYREALKWDSLPPQRRQQLETKARAAESRQ